MNKLALVLVLAAALDSASALAEQVAPVVAAPPAPPVPPAPAAPVATKVDYSTDPRMITAIRHANAVADLKCGQGIGNVDLNTRNAARACRRHMVNAAMTDAEIEIDKR